MSDRSAPRPAVRVLIVEDSAVVRRMLSHIVAQDRRLALVGAVDTAEEAMRELPRLRPDVISMDIRLPGMDGLEATRQIMAEQPTPIVVVADAGAHGATGLSMNALRAGALAVVEKPVGLTSEHYAAVADTICTQLFIMSQVPVIRRRPIGQAIGSWGSAGVGPGMGWGLAAGVGAAPGYAGAGRSVPAEAPVRQRPSLLGIAASTGGPPALARVLGGLPVDFGVPVLLVQHMGAPFMEGFAQWLDGIVPLGVRIAAEGERPLPGRVYVAPGDRHLALSPAGTLRLLDEAPVGGQRPSATLLFRSMAQVAGAGGCGVLLTGMGEDGARGLAELRQAGGFTVAEHESSCVVYGMPAAAVRLGAASAVLPLDLVAPRLVRLVQGYAGA